ncbi:MAG: class I SAM-dependent methyltransferase [Alphaproteobacteria bacterium]|nr:class I SAM-dependent methyltransferase [Alphaproteobacteria bacterium]
MRPTSSSVSARPLGDARVGNSMRQIIALLAHARHGTLTLQEPDGQTRVYGAGQSPHAMINVHDPAVFDMALKSGDIGFAEAYIERHWSTPDFSLLLQWALVNRRALDDVIYGRWWGRLFYRLRHWSRRNTRTNSAKNIHAHYDLGNDFYRLWLDSTMNYSSAWFQGDASLPLPQAQLAKMTRALNQVGLSAVADQRVLEIGCGWGAIAEMGARDHGARMTGVTLSQEQLAWARRRLDDAGLSADLRLQDYRDIADEPFDAIVSIEMLEAVGQAYWPTYFQSVRRLLKPGAKACIQTIVIDDALFDRYIRGTDFIQQYIFPGGCLPSPSRFCQAAERAGLVVEDSFNFGRDYAQTLRVWRHDFLARREEVLAQGFDDRFIRTWEFYLAYCEAAFEQGSTDVVQYTLSHPAQS